MIERRIVECSGKAQLRLSIGIAAVLMLSLVFGGVTVARSDRAMRTDLLRSAQLAAQAINIDLVKTLTGTGADLNNPDYLRLKEQLAACRAETAKCRDIYLMGRKDDGKVFFFIDVMDVSNQETPPAPPGEIYDDASTELLNIFNTKGSFVEGPLPDKWGVWISALVPLADPKTGAVVAVLGLDLDARSWKGDVAAKTAFPIGLMLTRLLAATLVIIGAYTSTSTFRSARWNGVASWFVLTIGLTMVTLSALHMKLGVERSVSHNFDVQCREIKNEITDRLHAHARILLSGAAFLNADETVTREEWRIYTKLQKIEQQLPGIQGLGFSLLIPRAELARHTQEIRNEGFPEYQVTPAGDRALYSSIIYLEPFSGRNLRAFGYDMFSEPVRRAAMEQARDEDTATLSGKVILDQETGEDIQAGTLMYVPVYHKDMPVESVEQRRAALYGWVYSPYRMNDLFRGILGGHNPEKEHPFRLQVFDGTQLSPQSLLYTSPSAESTPRQSKEHFDRQILIDFNGHHWMLCFTQLSGGFFTTQFALVWLTIVGGTCITLLLFALLQVLLNTRDKAERMAENLTVELCESETLQRALMDNLPMGVVIVDPASRVIERANDYVATLFGAPVEHLLGRRCHSFLCPASENACPVCDLGKTVDNSDREMLRADGSHLPILKTVKRILLTNGQEKLLECFVDISERKQAEAALMESEEKYRLLIENSHDIIYTLTAEGRLSFVSPAWNTILGHPLSQVVGQFFHPFIHPDDLPGCLAWKQKIADTGQRQEGFEYRVRHVDGSWRWHTSSAVPLRDGAGAVSGFVGTARDITERKNAEQALRENEANFRTFFETMTDMIMVGAPDGQLLFTNTAVTRTLGYSADELTSMHILDVHPADKRREAEAIFADMLSGDRTACPLPLAHKNGSLIPVETRVWSGRWNGADCIFGISKNLTAEQDAQQRFERLFRHNPALMALSTSPEHRFADVNDAFLKVLGYSKGDIIGKTAAELGLFPHPERQVALVDKLQADGRIAEFELQVRRKDGTILDGLFSGESISSQGREYFLTVMIDITKRKQAEADLRQTSTRLSLAAKAGGVGIWDYDVVNNRLVWDGQMFRLYGITAERFSGAYEAWQAGVHPDDRQRGDEEIKMALKGDKDFNTEFRVLWPDGTVHNIRALALVHRDASGQPLHMIGTNWDITAQKQAEAFLRSQTALFEAQLSATIDGILVIDENRRRILMNRRIVDLFNVPQHILGDKDDAALLKHVVSLTKAPELFLEKVMYLYGHNNETSRDEVEFKNGMVLDRYSAPVLGKDGKYYGRIWIFHNITHRKQAEKTLIETNLQLEAATAQATKMAALADAANTAKSSFLSNMSHEIRTPMNAVIGMTDLLMETKLDPEQRELANVVRVSGEALLSLINDILDFSKIEAGRLEIEKRDFDLMRCLEDTLDMVSPTAAEKDLELTCTVGSDVPAVVRGDSNRLRQILLNLLNNAIKFTSSGEVGVSVGGAPSGNGYQLAFFVHDTGSGIEPDRLEHIFKAFTQADVSVTRQHGGTGLGLTISRRLSELMGGYMRAESTPGKGSVFHFTIQVDSVRQVKTVHANQRPFTADQRDVLIVDDNQTNLKILSAQLTRWGLVPVAFNTPAAALQSIKDGREYILMITDFQMPVMNGAMLVEEVRTLRPAIELPIIMLTSVGAGKQDEVLDISSYLVKPAKSAVLYQHIANILNGECINNFEAASTPIERAAVSPWNLLLVEDNLLNQKVALRMLSKLGYKADLARDGIEALELVDAKIYDVILMDIQMPRMDGLTATEEIRKRLAGKKQPIIIGLSAHASTEEYDSGIGVGMDAYLTKPLQLTKLREFLLGIQDRLERNHG